MVAAEAAGQQMRVGEAEQRRRVEDKEIEHLGTE